MSFTLRSTIKLNDGHTMPRFGFGTYEAEGDEIHQAVLTALRNRQCALPRHAVSGIDAGLAAEWYGNEEDCGRAVRDFMQESGTPRAEIFYTTKLQSNSTEKHATDAIQKSLKLAGLDYVDLYLIHGPYPSKKARLASWDAICKAVTAGTIRSAGVSNYGIRHLEELMEHAKSANCSVKVPTVNQIDLHPFMQRREDVAFNRQHEIALMAWGPLARGMRFGNPTLKKVAEKTNKTPAQILLRWGLQKDFIVIPKSVSESRIRANADIFDFALDEADMAALDGLEEHLVTDWDPIGDNSV